MGALGRGAEENARLSSPNRYKKELVIVWWPIDKPMPAKNPRRITDAAADKVAASLREFGWPQPIVVDRHGVIVCGHVRLLAARKLGLQFVPILVAENLPPRAPRGFWRRLEDKSQEAARSA